MLRTRLFWKIFGTYLGIVVVTALMVALFASAPTADEYELSAQDLAERQLPLLAADYRDAIEMNTLDRLAERIHGLGLEGSVRLTIIDLDGRVLADSTDDPASMDDHGSRPEIAQARELGSGRSTRHSTTVGREMMYLARRVEGTDGSIGFVRVSIPARDVQVVSSRLRRSILLACLLAAAVGLALAWFLARRFTVPVRSLTNAATSIAAGDYERRVAIESTNELGELARAFNSMSGELQNRIATISAERGELQAILSGMVEGVVAVDSGGQIVLMNNAAHDLLGLPPESLGGKSLREAIPLQPVADVIARTLETERLEKSEVHLVETPHDRWLQLYAAPIRSAEVKSGVVLVMHDISELRRLERVRQDFVANASHELKTPVAAIHGLVETILDDDEMTEATERAFLERVQRQVVRLTDLIGEMLALSRLESPEEAPPEERLDLRAAVRSALEAVHPLADDRGVALHVDMPDAPSVVHGSAESLQRIVGNLVDNAVKFTPKGGSVRVRVRAADGRVVLEVEDQGPGIAPADRERVFERFYRLDRGRSRDVGGTGLGLAIVKHLVQGLGGDVGIADSPGGGSTFRVTLPLA